MHSLRSDIDHGLRLLAKLLKNGKKQVSARRGGWREAFLFKGKFAGDVWQHTGPISYRAVPQQVLN